MSGKDEETSARQIRGGGRARENRREYWYCGATQKGNRGVSKGKGRAGGSKKKGRADREGRKKGGGKTRVHP